MNGERCSNCLATGVTHSQAYSCGHLICTDCEKEDLECPVCLEEAFETYRPY